jgi:hypothetical protein
MGGDIWLDQSYHSRVEGCPGTGLVVDLNAPPLLLDSDLLESVGREGMTENVGFAFEPSYGLSRGAHCLGLVTRFSSQENLRVTNDTFMLAAWRQ